MNNHLAVKREEISSELVDRRFFFLYELLRAFSRLSRNFEHRLSLESLRTSSKLKKLGLGKQNETL